MASVRTTMYVCDNPSCFTRVEHSRDEPALGFHFDRGIYANRWGGGPIPKTFACQEECIAPALAARIEEERNR